MPKEQNTVKLIGIDPNAGNNPYNPNGFKLYAYKGQRIPAYRAKDVPNRYRWLFPNETKKK